MPTIFASIFLGSLALSVCLATAAEAPGAGGARWFRKLMVSHRGLLAALAAFAALLAVAAWGPVHDHLSFLGRTDCAYDWRCERHPPWSATTYRVFGGVLHLVPLPYGIDTPIAVGLAFSVATLALLYTFVVSLFAPTNGWQAARRDAGWAVALTALNPIFVRISVAGTLWPYVAFCLLAAANAALTASRRRRASLWVASAVLLALAAASNFAVLPWVLLAAVAPMAWIHFRDGSLARGASTAARAATLGACLVAGAVLTVPFALQTLAAVSELGGVSKQPIDGLLNQFALHPGQLPVAVSVLWLLGLTVAVRKARLLAPVTFAYVASEWILAAQVPLDSGYPTRFIHGFVSTLFIGFFAAQGVGVLVRAAGGSRFARWVQPALALVLLASLPSATQAVDFMTERRMLVDELRNLEAALDRLPEHDMLIVAPNILQKVGEPAFVEDPVEVRFPVVAYHERLRARGLPPTEVVRLDTFLDAGTEPRGRTLIYVGSSLRSWIRAEIAAGSVPSETIDRPPLRRFDGTWSRSPEVVFEVEAHDNPLNPQRLGADRFDRVELGFYRVHNGAAWNGGTTGSAERDDDPTTRLAQGRPIIEAGREAEIVRLVAPFEPGAPVGDGFTLAGIGIEATEVVYVVDGPSGRAEVRLGHPDFVRDSIRSTLSFSVSIHSDGDAADEAAKRLVDAIDSNDRVPFWGATVEDDSRGLRDSALTEGDRLAATRAAVSAALAGLVCGLVWCLVERRRER